MNARLVGCTGVLIITLAAGLYPSTAAAKDRFTLVAAVPDDVFFCVAGRHNAEREFLDDYWGEVFDALKESGVGADVMELMGSYMGDEQRAEVDRLKALASRLLDGVDWGKLVHGQVVFAERMNAPMRVGDNLTMGPPDMVWLMGGAEGSAAKNYDGLVAILQAITAEINKAAGKEAITVEMTQRLGAKVARVNFLAEVPQAPPIAVGVALRGEVIVITFGDKILGEVLGLLKGEGTKTSLAASSRFKQAFAQLPAAEDEMTFFDMQAMLASFRVIAEKALSEISASSDDAITNSRQSDEADRLAATGIKAYNQKDYKQALEYTKQAHEVAPTDSRIMYNLACFHALVGNENEALTWLEKAVDGGFNAPKQISHDSDLKSLRGNTRYEAALAKAAKHAPAKGKPNADTWKQLAERLMDVPGMIDYIASVTYTDGYAVRAEEITALVPGAADKPFYPVFARRASLTNFDRYLPEETVSFSVSRGIDLTELYAFVEGTIRSAGPKGEEILAKWAGLQEKFGVNVKKDVLGWIDGDAISVTMKHPAGNTSVFMLKVSDEAAARQKLASALEFLSTNMQQLAQQNPMLAMMMIRTAPTKNEKLPGFHDVSVGMMPQPGVCGVTDGYLILGSSADAVALCLATAAGEHPNIRKNTQLMAEAMIPAGSFRSVSLTDQRNLGTNIAQGIGVVSMAGGMLTMVIPDPDAQQVLMKVLPMVAKLGPVAQRIDFYKSTSQYTTFDGKVWYKRSVTNYRSPAERVASRGN